MQTTTQSSIDLPGIKRLRSGKVREVFNLGVLVQPFRQHSEPPCYGGFRKVPKGIASVPGATRWTVDDRKENEAARGGVRSARLSGWFWLERISGIAERLWNRASGRTKTSLAFTEANLHP